MDARATAENLEVPVQTTVSADQYDLEVIINALENLGFEIEKLEVINPEEEEKECKMTIKGTVDKKEVDLTIVVKGQTCTELFKEILKN
jgi:signal recognition particle subunit SEC65